MTCKLFRRRASYKKTPPGQRRGSTAKVFKIETTLDRGDFFPFASSAVKGHFIEFLISNILVTSLSFISDAALANGTHFPAQTASLSARD
jgi:hypothetical protein